MIAVLLFLTSKLTDWQEQEIFPGEKWPKAGLTVAPLGPRASGRERLRLVAAVMLLSIAKQQSAPFLSAPSLGYQPFIYTRNKFTC